MNAVDLLRSLGIDPAQLDSAPPPAQRQAAGAERLDGSHPCARCGEPATATGVVVAPGYGRRWLDRCMPCLIATTPRGGPRRPLENTVAVLRDAAAEAGVKLSIIVDQ